MKQKGFFILAGMVLCVLIMIGLLGNVNPARAELGTGVLSVGGVDIVQAPNKTVSGGNGTATLTYENSKPVLTLENYTCTRSGIDYEGAEDFTITLKGTNTIQDDSAESSIISKGNLTINGSGSLNLHGRTCLYGLYNISVTGGTIYAETNSTYSTVGIYCGEDLTISGGTVTAVCCESDHSSGIWANNILITGGAVTAAAGVPKSGTSYKKSHRCITKSDAPTQCTHLHPRMHPRCTWYQILNTGERKRQRGRIYCLVFFLHSFPINASLFERLMIRPTVLKTNDTSPCLIRPLVLQFNQFNPLLRNHIRG